MNSLSTVKFTEITLVRDSQLKSDENVRQIVKDLLWSHFDPDSIKIIGTNATMEDAIIQLKESAAEILHLAVELHRVHCGQRNDANHPVSTYSKDLYDMQYGQYPDPTQGTFIKKSLFPRNKTIRKKKAK